MTGDDDENSQQPLLSNAFLFKLTAFIGILAALTVAITVAAKIYGGQLAQDGHTTDDTTIHIAVGQDLLAIPANMIRFETQRHDGQARAINLYLSWPQMQGYAEDTAGLFTDPDGAQSLIFVEISQSVMSRDMSGRLEPIYSKLFKGAPEPGPAGLVKHRLNDRSGFADEVLLTGTDKSGSPYVVRCLLPAQAAAATSADCQRDIHIGRDLSLLYRFSSQNLPHWQDIDTRIRTFAAAHLRNETP